MLTDKCTEKCTEKRTEKRNVFTEFFHRNFPRIFGVCFSAVRTVNATEKRPPKNSARISIAAQSKIQSADVAGVEASQHAHLRSKNDPEKNRKFLQLAVLHLSAFQHYQGFKGKGGDQLQEGERKGAKGKGEGKGKLKGKPMAKRAAGPLR